MFTINMAKDNTNNTSNERKNVVDAMQVFVEDNFRTIRGGLYLTGGLIAVYIGWKIHMTAVFKHVDEIPSDFIQKQYRLLGKVREIRDDGALNVQHVPILELRVPFTKRKDKGSLLVNLACIDVTPAGRAWLTHNVEHKTVWFHLLHRSQHSGEPVLYSKVVVPKPLRRNLCVNEELLRLGLCKISQLSDITDLGIASNQNMVKYLDRLVRLEHQAAKKGVGMWTETKEKSITRKGLNLVKNLVVGPFNMLRWVFRKMRRKKT